MSQTVFKPEQFSAPRPPKKTKLLVSAHGDERTDEYYWLNERENPDVVAYLEAENRYADSILAPVAALREQLFAEMKGRIKEDDHTVPYFDNGYWYYTRYETGREYPLYCRKKNLQATAEEVLLDVNELAAGHSFCDVGALVVSPDNQSMAFSVDYSGRYLYQANVVALADREPLTKPFDVAGTLLWGNDSKTLYYDTKDRTTLRTDKIWRRHLAQPEEPDQLLYHEQDETLYANIYKSKSDQYIFLSLGYTQTSENHFLNADDPNARFTLIKPREDGFYYNVEHHSGHFLIKTNWNAVNFRLMKTPVNAWAAENWTDVLPHRNDVLLEDFQPFEKFIVALERKAGLKQLHIVRWPDLSDHYIDVGEPTYETSFGPNPDFAAVQLRYQFSSLKTPATVVDYHMETREKTVKKVQPVLGGFDASQYQTEFCWVKARDGVSVPVSLMYKKGLKRDGSAPCLLVGYGSYGFSYDPAFNRDIISLADRGFIYGIAHIRGGMEMGFQWYEDGRMLRKMNTFTDFIDVAGWLCVQNYTGSDRLFASGRSAGGLLMGAVANMAPAQFRGIITGVPFVDVLTTMSDPSIPLTTGEYGEWGNPAVREQYDYMKQYSPYDQVRAANYPNMLVLTSFSDSQVQYFEPAKYVAKLRDLKTDDNVLLFKTNMTGSHGGASGRFERLQERALEFAWMLGVLGM